MVPATAAPSGISGVTGVLSSAIAGQSPFELRLMGADSDVEEADILGVALDEGAPGLDVLAHQHREEVVGEGRVVQGDLTQHTVVDIHGGDPQLLGVHLAEALEALDRVLAHALAVLPPQL